MTGDERTEPLAKQTDAFVFVVLGLLSQLERIEHVAEPSPVDDATTTDTVASTDDAAAMAVLGLCSFQRTFARWLEIAACDDETPDVPRTPRTAPRTIAR